MLIYSTTRKLLAQNVVHVENKCSFQAIPTPVSLVAKRPVYTDFSPPGYVTLIQPNMGQLIIVAYLHLILVDKFIMVLVLEIPSAIFHGAMGDRYPKGINSLLEWFWRNTYPSLSTRSRNSRLVC